MINILQYTDLGLNDDRRHHCPCLIFWIILAVIVVIVLIVHTPVGVLLRHYYQGENVYFSYICTCSLQSEY